MNATTASRLGEEIAADLVRYFEQQADLADNIVELVEQGEPETLPLENSDEEESLIEAALHDVRVWITTALEDARRVVAERAAE